MKLLAVSSGARWGGVRSSGASARGWRRGNGLFSFGGEGGTGNGIGGGVNDSGELGKESVADLGSSGLVGNDVGLLA